MKRLLCIALLFVMVIGVVPVNAKTPKISEYLETSFDVYNVPIVDSYTEFKEMIDNKKIKPAIEDGGSNILYTISAKQNGCIVLYGKDNYATNYYFSLLDVTNKTTYEIWGNHGNKYNGFPMRKGDKFALQGKGLTFYVGFIPENYIFQVDESKKNENGTLAFIFGNVYGNDTVLSVMASEKTYSTRQVITDDITLPSYKTTTLYEYSSVATDNGDAVLTLPKAGEYTLTFRLKTKDNTIAVSSMILDTNVYINPTLDTLEAPISAITGTNVIVGYGEPYATVYVSYKNKKYYGKCDKNGIYRIVLNTEMEKGVKFKIWQADGKLKSKKASYRVTSEL